MSPVVPRRPDRPQDGSALLTAVALLLVVALVALGLLGRLQVDVAATARSLNASRLARIVDGGLDVGITRVATSPGAVLGTQQSCPGPRGTVLATVRIEGRDVTVRCVGSAVSVPPVAGGVDHDALLLLANYNGALDDLANTELSGVLGGVVQGVAGWLNLFFANGPGLIHAGSDPLRVVGRTRVRQSAVAYRYSPTAGPTVAGPSPALDVAGAYEQGDCGLLGCIDISLFGNPILHTPPCGVLDPSFAAPGDLGLAARSIPGPACNLGRGAAAFADPNFAPPATWAAADIRARAATLPACPAPGGVVRFTPGAYGRNLTTILNVWFRAGSCDGVTFWFAPGDYYFDVSGTVGDDRNALVFDDPTSSFVFGQPAGWDPAAGAAPASAFPMACDPSQPGVSVTLSSRTSLKHRNGRAALCGTPTPPGGTPRSLLHQLRSADTVTWGGVPRTAVNVAGWTNPDAATHSTAPVPPTYPANAGPWDQSEPTPVGAQATCLALCAPVLRLTGFSDPGAPAPQGELTSARLRIRGDTSDVWFPTTRVNVVYGDGSGQCTADLPLTMADNWNVVDVDLVALCRSSYGLVDAGQLEGATVNLTYEMSPGPCFLWTCPPPARASVDYVWLETTTAFRPSSSMEVAIDPASGREITFSGRVDIPRSQVEVRWWGGANRAPVFIGGLVARALASAPPSAAATTYRTGVLAAAGYVPGARRVQIRAEMGGRLVGTAEVLVNDTDASGTVFDPAREVKVLEWRRCSRPDDSADCD